MLRDPRSGFIAYAPVGSINRGEVLVKTGGNGKTDGMCGVCHGLDLQGLGQCRGLRLSPSYLVRQLCDMRFRGSSRRLDRPDGSSSSPSFHRRGSREHRRIRVVPRAPGRGLDTIADAGARLQSYASAAVCERHFSISSVMVGLPADTDSIQSKTDGRKGSDSIQTGATCASMRSATKSGFQLRGSGKVADEKEMDESHVRRTCRLCAEREQATAMCVVSSRSNRRHSFSPRHLPGPPRGSPDPPERQPAARARQTSSAGSQSTGLALAAVNGNPDSAREPGFGQMPADVSTRIRQSHFRSLRADDRSLAARTSSGNIRSAVRQPRPAIATQAHANFASTWCAKRRPSDRRRDQSMTLDRNWYGSG